MIVALDSLLVILKIDAGLCFANFISNLSSLLAIDFKPTNILQSRLAACKSDIKLTIT
jgi:hypothetical protein